MIPLSTWDFFFLIALGPTGLADCHEGMAASMTKEDATFGTSVHMMTATTAMPVTLVDMMHAGCCRVTESMNGEVLIFRMTADTKHFSYAPIKQMA